MKKNLLYIIPLLMILAIAGASMLFARGGNSPDPAGGAPVFDETAYPPVGWTANISEAVETALAEDKMILLNFTGSDWCVWCQKLEKEVFSQQEFLNWANENAVMVFIDSPSNIDLNDNQVQHNQILQQAMGVQGFPTIFLLDSDLTPLLQTGYKEGGTSVYLTHLENDRLNMSAGDAENFRKGFGQMVEEVLLPLNL